jgi:hypothetical protein
MPTQRPIDVEVVDLHVRIKYGKILMHSEEYSTTANARRAARDLVKAINTRPMRLIYWDLRGVPHRVVKVVRKVWQSGAGKTIVLPIDGGPDTARPPYFDPHLESD